MADHSALIKGGIPKT